MSVLQIVTARAAVVISRFRFAMGTTAGLAITYGTYQTLVGGNQYVKRAKTEGLKSPSPYVQKAPFQGSEAPSDDGSQPRPELAASPQCQPSLVTHDKAHAVFLWIKINPKTDVQQVACRLAKLQQLVNTVEDPTTCLCGNQEINAGVGFGPEFYQQVKGDVPQPFSNDKHSLISTESDCGDILIHAKSNNLEYLKLLNKLITEQLPDDSVQWVEETYVDGHHNHPETFVPKTKKYADSKWGFKKNDFVNQYKLLHNHPVSRSKLRKQSEKERLNTLNYQYAEGKMQLFPTEPPEQEKQCLLFVKESGSEDTESKRKEMGLDPNTGGSYVMTQKWLHDINLVCSNGEVVMNEWVEKAWNACAEPSGERKSIDLLGKELADLSMDQWMDDAYQECLNSQKKHPEEQILCTPGFSPTSPFRILRQSLPYKNNGQSGLFIVSYASTPKYNELLLDRLIASACGEGKQNYACKNVFQLSRNLRSACWYFPGVEELQELSGEKGSKNNNVEKGSKNNNVEKGSKNNNVEKGSKNNNVKETRGKAKK